MLFESCGVVNATVCFFFRYIKEWSFEKLHQKKVLKRFPFLLEAEDE